eukprot:6417001-Prymnesium_polylepis.1
MRWVVHHRLCNSRRDSEVGLMQARKGSIAATRPSLGRDHSAHMLPPPPASFCALSQQEARLELAWSYTTETAEETLQTIF